MLPIVTKPTHQVPIFDRVTNRLEHYLAQDLSTSASIGMIRLLNKFHANVGLDLRDQVVTENDLTPMTAFLSVLLVGLNNIAKFQNVLSSKECYTEPDIRIKSNNTLRKLLNICPILETKNYQNYTKQEKIRNDKAGMRLLGGAMLLMPALLCLIHFFIDDEHHSKQSYFYEQLAAISGLFLFICGANGYSASEHKAKRKLGRSYDAKLLHQSTMVFFNSKIPVLPDTGFRDAGFFANNKTARPTSLYEVAQKLASRLIELERNVPEQVTDVFKEYLQENSAYDMRELDIKQFLSIEVKFNGTVQIGLNLRASLPEILDLEEIITPLINNSANDILKM